MSSTKWIAALTFLIGIGVGVIAAPLRSEIVIAFAKDDYGRLVFRCDQAMKSHLIAKQRLNLEPSETAVTELRAAEAGLLDCQEYDLKRKQLQRWGLTEADLATIGLLAIEANASNLNKVVETHEFHY